MDFADILKQLGANLRQARWAAGMTQEEVAAKGISYRYYQELERGQRNPTLRMLADLAGIFRVNVAQLVETDPTAVIRDRIPLADLDVSAPRRGRKPKKS